jgi:hypothetical protein
MERTKTGWLVYRCEAHKITKYINANPRPGAVPARLCCDEATMVEVADEAEFCAVLKAVAS